MELSAHSDILVHWTGRDIEQQSISEARKGELYFERLKSILKFGFWMTIPREQESLKINGSEINKPGIPRSCFTELKLSSSEDHAKLYGRLGIGVKRYFLFDRLGAPINYCQFGTHNHFFPPYSDAITRDDSGKELLAFFKHMCASEDRPLKYDLYNESEWRIIFSENIKSKLINNGRQDRSDLFVDPKKTANKEIAEFYAKLPLENRPEYLIPLDPWLAIIIYPDLRTKAMSIASHEIRESLEYISIRPTVTGCPERGFFPTEVDLGACKNF